MVKKTIKQIFVKKNLSLLSFDITECSYATVHDFVLVPSMPCIDEESGLIPGTP